MSQMTAGQALSQMQQNLINLAATIGGVIRNIQLSIGDISTIDTDVMFTLDGINEQISDVLSVNSIIDNLTTQDATLVLSAKQGYVINQLINTVKSDIASIKNTLSTTDFSYDTLQEIGDKLSALGNSVNASITDITGITIVSPSAGQVLMAVDVNGTIVWENKDLPTSTTSAAITATDIAGSNTLSKVYPAMLSSGGDVTTLDYSSTGCYFKPSTGEFFATELSSLSDSRYKTDIETISNALGIIEQINPVTFTFTETEKRSAGVIAQELEKILPDLVNTPNNRDDKYSVNYLGIIGYLVGAVQELSAKVTVLEAK